MRKLCLLLLLTACSHVHSNNDVKIFDVKLVLNEACQLEVSTSSTAVKHDFKFEQGGECRIVTHPHTSITATHFINGSYIVFIEKNHNETDDCYSENTAIAINSDQKLLTTPVIKRSGSCFQAQELTAFEYFSTKLKYNQDLK